MASGDRPATGRKGGKRKGAGDDKAQSERFKENARQLGVDETGKAFEREMDKVITPKPKPRSRDHE